MSSYTWLMSVEHSHYTCKKVNPRRSTGHQKLRLLTTTFHLPLFLSVLSSSSPSYLIPPPPICYLPAGSVLHCTAVDLQKTQAGWLTHLQSAALKPRRRQPHPRTPLLSTCTLAGSACACKGRGRFFWDGNACVPTPTHGGLNLTQQKKKSLIIACLWANIRCFK